MARSGALNITFGMGIWGRECLFMQSRVYPDRKTFVM